MEYFPSSANVEETTLLKALSGNSHTTPKLSISHTSRANLFVGFHNLFTVRGSNRSVDFQ